MGGGGGGEFEGLSLEYTPTWVVAVVCSGIIGMSLVAERGLHSAGKYLKKRNQNPLYEALLKVKEELMLLGFISLLLTVSQNYLTKMCMKPTLMFKMLPCPVPHQYYDDLETASDAEHSEPDSVSGITRRLLAASAQAHWGYCARKNKVPLLSVEAIHHLHIFIFVLAMFHVSFSVMTICFGGLKIRQWKQWEESVAKELTENESGQKKVTYVQDHDFVKDHYLGIGENIRIKGWIHSFKNQFYGSVTKSDYLTLRLGFISTHCQNNPKFDFHNYMVRALEDDFKKVVKISWYLWIFVILFMLINLNGWHAYFWISFIPLFILLAVGTKLQHVITQLAHEVAEKHVAVEGDLLVKPSDDHFWFGRPKVMLILIHFILFQNAFEMAYLVWLWAQYGYHSCIMGKFRYIVPRILIGLFIQFLCSYSTLPLYAIVTQMGSNFKKRIFVDRIQSTVSDWSQRATRKKADVDGSGEIQLENKH